MTEDVIAEIEAYLDGESGEVPLAYGDKIGCTVDYSAGRNRYIGYLISLATRSYKGMRVGLDCSNGSAWMIAKSVFDSLGAKTYVTITIRMVSILIQTAAPHISMCCRILSKRNSWT